MPAFRPVLRYVALPLTITALLIGGLSVSPAQATETPRSVSLKPLRATYVLPRYTKVENALRVAQAQIGDPYRYGAAGPNSFDCSGLVYFATRRAGFKGVPRSSAAQARYMRRIPKQAIRKGDFVFFTNGRSVYHVGIYVGRNRILHSPYSGTRVRVERIWTSSWFAGTLRGR